MEIGRKVGIVDLDFEIESSTNNPAIYTERGNLRFSQNDFEGAIKDYSKAIELRPSFFMYYFNRGYCRHGAKDFIGAIADCSRAIELNPKHEGSYFNRGLAKCALKDLNGAYDDFEKAIELRPRFVDAYYMRGLVSCEFIKDCYNPLKDKSLKSHFTGERKLLKEEIEKFEKKLGIY